MSSCKYADVFGKVGGGIHSVRLFNIAVVDVLFTLLAAYLLQKWLGGMLLGWIVLLFLLGIVLHRFFCVKTTVDKFLF